MTATTSATSTSARIALSALAAILAISLAPTPQQAHAATGGAYTATSVATQGVTAGTQAAKTKVKVLTVKPTESSSNHGITYSYNSNGLLARAVDEDNDYRVVSKFSYNKRGDVTAYTMKDLGGTSMQYFSDSKTTVKRAKSGLPTKKVTKYGRGAYKGTVKTITYTVKSGKVRSSKVTYKRKGEKNRLLAAYTYTYKNGKLRTLTDKKYTMSDGKLKLDHKIKGTYAYDKAGNLKSIKGANFICAYDDLPQQLCNWGNSYLSDCTFKEIEVPNALVSKVKAQQWALLNRNFNFVF